MIKTLEGDEEIHLWIVTTDALGPAARQRAVAVLNPAERARAARFRHDADALHFEAAHALKRMVLSHAVAGAVAPGQWRFTASARGKPEVAGGGPHFNLSHCAGLVACAVCRAGPVGLDVEPIGRAAALAVAQSSFAAAECEWLASLPRAAQVDGALRLWTLREAYAKATGEGLGVARRDIAFCTDPPSIAFVRGQPAGPPWRLHQQCVDSAHLLALAWQSDEAWPVRVRRVQL